MKPEQFVTDTPMNETIYRCLEYISREDVEKFKQEFRREKSHERQEQKGLYWKSTHTVRELIVGAHLCYIGFDARYAKLVDDKTPDWSIWQTVSEHQELRGIVEVASLHAHKEVENELWKAGRVLDGLSDNDRLREAISEKIGKYKSLVEKHGVPFAVAVFLQFPVNVRLVEDDEILLDLFKTYPALSGLMLVENDKGNSVLPNYRFVYCKNPEPLREINLAPKNQGPKVGTL